MAVPKPITPLPPTAFQIMQIVINGKVTDAGSKDTPCGNVYYYARTVVGAALNKTNVKTAFWTQVGVPLLAAANAAYSPVSITLRRIDDATDAPVIITQAGAGAIATDAEPSVDAVVNILKTAQRGKNARGFKHHGGTSEVDTTQNILTGAGLARWQAVAAAEAGAFVDADGNTWTPFLFSPYKSQITINPTTVRGLPIASVTCRKVVGTMRRRKARIIL